MGGRRYKMRSGFTLAEVLITLGIIGIIAEMTIPTLMNNVQDQVLKTSWKKAFSDLSQVTQLISTDNGGTLNGVFANPTQFRDKFLEKMAFNKKCDGSNIKNECWNDIGAYNLANHVQFQTDAWWFSPTYSTAAVLNNGMTLLFDDNYDVYECNNNTLGSYPYCGTIFVDVNGFKKPNTLGKDVFRIFVYENKTQAFGNGSTCDGDGSNCGAYYLIH